MGKDDIIDLNNNSKKPLVVIICLCIAAVLLIGAIVLVKVFANTAGSGAEKPEVSTAAGGVIDADTIQEKWQEGVVEYNGEKYQYNNRLKVYLLMGVDNDNEVQPAKDYTSGGQSDAMFLLIANTETEELSVFSINRNTMTDVEVYSEDGVSLGSFINQICLQHAFGDGQKLSCNLAQNAVSKLFYNIPIDGYIAMNMGGIPMMNDAIGGVTVEVLPGLEYLDKSVGFKTGEEITLSGKQAYTYLRGRDQNEFNSATLRLRRQEQYILAFMEKLKENNSVSVTDIIKLYEGISPYMVTSVDFTKLVGQLLNYQYDDSRLYTVPGEMKDSETWEEYHVDETAFYDMIIRVFYNKVSGAQSKTN